MKSFNSFIREEKSKDDKHVVLAFGRFNPPHIGHEKLIDKVHSVAEEHNAEHKVVLSHTQDDKVNPLEPKEKEKFVKEAFPNTNVSLADKEKPTILHHAKDLNKKFSHLHIVAGDDRVQEYQQLLDKYNKRDYNYDSITVHSSGDRSDSASGVEGVSASKLRDYAKSGNFAEFEKSIPKHISSRNKKELFNKVRKGLGLKESKALFVVGPQASGKDILITEIKKYFDIVEVSLDQLKTRKKLKLENHANIIISDMAYNYDLIEDSIAYLTENGYDIHMIFVNISNEESIVRNINRNISESVRYEKWKKSQNNVPLLNKHFQDGMIYFENSRPIDENIDAVKDVFRHINTFLIKTDSLNEQFKQFYVREIYNFANGSIDVPKDVPDEVNKNVKIPKKLQKKDPPTSGKQPVVPSVGVNLTYDTKLQGGSFPYSLTSEDAYNDTGSEHSPAFGSMGSNKEPLETLNDKALSNLKPVNFMDKKKKFKDLRKNG